MLLGTGAWPALRGYRTVTRRAQSPILFSLRAMPISPPSRRLVLEATRSLAQDPHVAQLPLDLPRAGPYRDRRLHDHINRCAGTQRVAGLVQHAPPIPPDNAQGATIARSPVRSGPVPDRQRYVPPVRPHRPRRFGKPNTTQSHTGLGIR